jgi:tRNA pseudouridine55 synthase
MSAEVDGILLLDKPPGPSSNQALQRAKRVFNARKAGHAGTLDPLASGLLPVLFGEATKFAGCLSDAEKGYEATVLLGVTTSTGDMAGEVLAKRPVQSTRDAVFDAAARFVGPIEQLPPMHSAIKVGGRPLYFLARRGETIERAKRHVTIIELSVLDVRLPEFDIRVRCSKGTYIRVLADDIGAVLGCGATLKRLRRTRVGPFSVQSATALDQLEQGHVGQEVLLAVDAAVSDIPVEWLDTVEAERIQKGQGVARPARMGGARVRLMDACSKRFLGIGEITEQGLQPRRLVRNSGGG